MGNSTNSTSSHSEIEKKNDQSNEPKNNVATPKNDAKVVKDEGQQKTMALTSKRNEYGK